MRKYKTWCPNCGTMMLFEMGEIRHCEKCDTIIGRYKDVDDIEGTSLGYSLQVHHSERQLQEATDERKDQ